MSEKVSWLKKLGLFIASGVSEAAKFLPILEPFVALLPASMQGKVNGILPEVVDYLGQMQGIIVNVEAMGAAMNPAVGGAQKLAAAIPYFSSLLSASEALAGHKVANPELFTKAVVGYAQATVDLLNSREAGSGPA